MRIQTLMIGLLAWAGLGLASASAEIFKRPLPAQPPAAAEAGDPSEPPIQVEVSHGQVTYGRGARAGGSGQKAEVTSGARGTTIKLPTNGSYGGTAALAFKNSAPPMRFTVKLSQMPNTDLQSLTMNSGPLALGVGAVTTSETTRYFDARGRVQEGPAGAAYTVTARRSDGTGQVEVELRRAPGAALGGTVTLGWQCQPIDNVRMLGFKRLGG